MQPLIVTITHSLTLNEARRRIDAGVDKLPAHIPGALAQVNANWTTDRQMTLDVQTMGQNIVSTLDVDERQVAVTVQLPLLLQFARSTIEGIVRRSGEKLLLEQHV